MADEHEGGGRVNEGEREKPALRIVGGEEGTARPDPWLDPKWIATTETVVAAFRARHGERFLFVEKRGVYEWTRHVWRLDECRTVKRLTAELCRAIGPKRKKGERQKVEGAPFIKGCAERICDEAATTFDRFDQVDVLNMSTAAVSLKANGAAGWAVLPQRREDYCSKMAGTTAERGPCPLWLGFLDKITAGDAELVAYLQRMAGYCATRETKEQTFFFCYGTGGNGKGTFLNAIKAVLGDYATQASLELFVEHKPGHRPHPEELASLASARLVLTDETSEGHAWDAAKIKTLTGGGAQRARFMFKDSFEYKPVFKIVISGNSKPVLRKVDPAMRRRLHLIPFTVQFAGAELDRDFADKLIPEYPAILAWVLDGYVAWRERGLDPPECVLGATEDYFDNQDLLQQWIDQCCDRTDPNAFTSSTDLHKSWKLFCENAGERWESCKRFVDRLEGKGFNRDRKSIARGFVGVKLHTVSTTPDTPDMDRYR